MFTAGRILSKRAELRAAERASIFGDQLPSTTGDSRERRKFRCYVPFVWQSVLASVAGFVVMTAGISLCIAGFYTVHQPQHNYTEVFNMTLCNSLIIRSKRCFNSGES